MYPAALSDGGNIYSCQKSQLVSILETYANFPTDEPKTDIIITDGSALVNSLTPRKAKTFNQFVVENVFPVITSCASKYKRTDVVSNFDVYLPCSLKAETRLRVREPEEESLKMGKCLTTGEAF